MYTETTIEIRNHLVILHSKIMVRKRHSKMEKGKY